MMTPKAGLVLEEFLATEVAQRMPGYWTSDSDWSPYSRQAFEEVFGHYFRSVRATKLAGSGRWIYLMELRQGENT